MQTGNQLDEMASGSNPPWRPLVTDSLSPEAIDAVLQRRVPYVHVPGFIDPAWCEEIIRRYDAALDTVPDHRGLTMGPALLDALVMPVELFVDSRDSSRYFTHVAEDAARMRALFNGGDDPLAMMRQAWGAAGWTEVDAAEDAQRRYHPDAIWGLRRAAAPPHVDAYEHDRQIALSRFDRRINYNVYLQNGESGGHFVIYNRCASSQASDAEPRALDAEWSAKLLAGAERLEHRPAPGDMVIFDAMTYHEVTAVDGMRTPRIQIHSNMLLDSSSREYVFFV
jgi:hypothetical protein